MLAFAELESKRCGKIPPIFAVFVWLGRRSRRRVHSASVRTGVVPGRFCLGDSTREGKRFPMLPALGICAGRDFAEVLAGARCAYDLLPKGVRRGVGGDGAYPERGVSSWVGGLHPSRCKHAELPSLLRRDVEDNAPPTSAH